MSFGNWPITESLNSLWGENKSIFWVWNKENLGSFTGSWHGYNNKYVNINYISLNLTHITIWWVWCPSTYGSHMSADTILKQERTLERKNRPGPGYVRIIGSFKDIIGLSTKKAINNWVIQQV